VGRYRCFFSNKSLGKFCEKFLEAGRVFSNADHDKRKLQTYCEFADLSDQIGQANEEGDTKKLRSYLKK